MRCPKCGAHMVPDHGWAMWDCRSCGHSVTDMTLVAERRHPEDEMYEKFMCVCGKRKQKLKGKLFCPDCDPPEELDKAELELLKMEKT